MQKAIDHKNFFYPPGGILLWMIIVLEIITFGAALLALMYYAGQEPEIFRESSAKLNSTLGPMNTIVLLASGFFMAQAVHVFKAGDNKKASRFIWFAIFGGAVFIVIKAFEYSAKIESGLTIGANTFFMFYWLLTAFHLVHVAVGMVILAVINRSVAKNKEGILDDLQAGAAFWHMCDLIWLLLFPVLYLIL